MTQLDNNTLDPNKTDLMVSVAKSAVGWVPGMGTLLTEIVGAVIPNQRIDRLTKYLKQLDEKLSSVPIEKIKTLFDNEAFIDLIEEGFVQAARAISNERRDYIASIIFCGIDKEAIAYHESKVLLKVLQELNDVEILWLRYYLNPTVKGDTEFREKHKDLFKTILLFSNADDETQRKAAMQQSFTDHLERLNLIETYHVMDRKTKQPEYDSSGRPKKSFPRITTLGKLLLIQTGVIDTFK